MYHVRLLGDASQGLSHAPTSNQHIHGGLQDLLTERRGPSPAPTLLWAFLLPVDNRSLSYSGLSTQQPAPWPLGT